MKNLIQIKDALGLDYLSQEQQEQVLLELGELIYKGSMVKVMEKMSPKTREKFMNLVEEGGSDEEIQEFISHVPESQNAVAETIQELADDILAVTKNNG